MMSAVHDHIYGSHIRMTFTGCTGYLYGVLVHAFMRMLHSHQAELQKSKGEMKMAKLLVVRAHPVTNRPSRSMTVTDAFVQSYIEHHPVDTVEDINVYGIDVPEIDADLLNAWDEMVKGTKFYALSTSQQHKITLFDSLTASFLEHDKIVVANPFICKKFCS